MTTEQSMESQRMLAARSVGRRPVRMGVLRYVVGMMGLSGLVSCLIGCHDLTNQPLPAGTVDPSTFDTPAGALGMRNVALGTLEQALPSYITDTGLLTDELESNATGIDQACSPNVQIGCAKVTAGDSLDARVLPGGEAAGAGNFTTFSAGDYTNLQSVRGSIAQALGALAAYDTTAADTALVKLRRGELYALMGYTDILLADFFCSGVPLSTLDFQKDFTYHASSTTAQVYQVASAYADSAMALASASDSIMTLARVVKGRALLDLGDPQSVATAAQVVGVIPDGSQYRFQLLWAVSFSVLNQLSDKATVSNLEGGTGLPFGFGDPRTTDTVLYNIGQTNTGVLNVVQVPITFPNKYSLQGYSPFPVADWIEARLIKAEAALRTHDTGTWLTLLNDLRQTAMVPGQTTTLGPLTDPGDSPGDSARISLLFRERAYWLFLTGHRQGDLRRLIRQFNRPQEQVYPTGTFNAVGFSRYGSDVTAPIPATEDVNPLFHGCIDRDA